MAVKEREIQIGGNRVCLGENNIVRITILGDVDEETEVRINEAVYKFMKIVEGKVHALIDLNRAGKTLPGARKKQLEISEHERTGKVALFGLHPVARVVASFTMGLSRNQDMRFFKTEEEALAWLKE